ncbi:MAG: sulfatase-like hydrolase/transferase [Candidatus Micrarchaeaceae archaeon]
MPESVAIKSMNSWIRSRGIGTPKVAYQSCGFTLNYGGPSAKSARPTTRFRKASLEMRSILVLPLLLGMFNCSAANLAAVQASGTLPYNVIFITPDQLRADFMHTYGFPLPDTPNINRLAQRGTLFLHAYSAGAWTTPSFGSIFTGLFPTVHGMTLPPYEGCGPYITHPMITNRLPTIPTAVNLSRHKPLLSEILESAGMTTAVDDANCWSIFDQVGRGWDYFKFFPGYQLPNPDHPDIFSTFYLTAPKTTAWAQRWLSQHKDQRFFLWVHFMEPHSPYNAPRSYDKFNTPDDFPNLYEDNRADSEKLQSLAKIGNVHAIQRLKELYAAKILYMDHYVGELIDTIDALGLEKNTFIVFLSDHGQLLYSHPKDFNTDDHRSLYDADLHVPLIFVGPGIPSGRRVKAIVGQYDLVPTILDLEGLPPLHRVDGKSLKPVLVGQAAQVHHYVYSEETALTPQYSIRDDRYKLIETLRTGRVQCFDTAVDPGETKSICRAMPQRAAELKAALDKHIQRMIREAKSYPDWKNNIALAVVEQRDSKSLRILAPRDITVGPGPAAAFQLRPQGWYLANSSPGCSSPCYWVPPPPPLSTVVWRFDTPMIGEYEIFVRYGNLGRQQATDANYIVRFKGGTLSFPVDQSHDPNHWVLLGRFHDPISVRLTNRANGPVVAGAVRFRRLPENAVTPRKQ